jgi:serine protease Do
VVERGWLGVEIQPVTQDIADSLGLKTASGALVAKENKDAPAAAAGVKIGDVVTAVNGQSVADPRELARRIADLGPKKSAELTIWRNGAQQTVSVTLGAMPNDKEAMNDQGTNKPDAADTSVAKLGLTLERGRDGVTITDVDPNSVAADKGLQQGDVILEASGKAVERPTEIAQAFDAARADGRKSVLLRVKTGDTVRFVALPAQAAS